MMVLLLLSRINALKSKKWHHSLAQDPPKCCIINKCSTHQAVFKYDVFTVTGDSIDDSQAVKHTLRFFNSIPNIPSEPRGEQEAKYLQQPRQHAITATSSFIYLCLRTYSPGEISVFSYACHMGSHKNKKKTKKPTLLTVFRRQRQRLLLSIGYILGLFLLAKQNHEMWI